MLFPEKEYAHKIHLRKNFINGTSITEPENGNTVLWFQDFSNKEIRCRKISVSCKLHTHTCTHITKYQIVKHLIE